MYVDIWYMMKYILEYFSLEINEDTYTQFLPSPSPGPASRPSSSSTNSTSSGQIQLWQFLLQVRLI